MENYTPTYKYPLTESDGWRGLSGELPVKMTNDYLFRALLQSDNETLKAILASVLHMKAEDIRSARITNEILLGERIDSKTFILDVSVVLNDERRIDLEMQVIKEKWWRERSLSYICRSFDNLNKSIPYSSVKPVMQIAFCDFTLFEDFPEFYADYKIVNVRRPEVVYTDKFVITNIDLTRIDLATAGDREYGVDKWARLFKAQTWEEMKMLAEKDKTMERAISSVWQLTEEEMIREQCRAREEWIINDNWKNETIEKQGEEIAKLKEDNNQLSEQVQVILQEQHRAREEWIINDNWKNETIEKQGKTIEEQGGIIKSQEEKIKHLEEMLEQLNEKVRLLQG